MLARAYFRLVDDIGSAATDEQLETIRSQVTATALHPIERRELERQLLSREQALIVEL